MFVFWLVYRKLPALDIEAVMNTTSPEDAKKAREMRQWRMIKLWVFADAHLIPNVQNAAMEVLISQLQAVHPSGECVRLALTIAPLKSALSEAFVAAAAHWYGEGKRYARPTYTDDELDILGGSPGFTAAMLGGLMKCGTVLCGKSCTNMPSLEGEWDRRKWLVEES